MAISLIGGPIAQRRGGAFAKEVLTQSTATTFQAISLVTGLTTVGMGTATDLNMYSLAAGTENQEKFILATATGEARIFLNGGTATGLWILGSADDWLVTRFFGGSWRIIQTNGATLATAT